MSFCPLEKCLLVHPRPRHSLRFFANFAPRDRTFHNRPRLVPFRPQNANRFFDCLSRQQDLNCKSLKENCEPTTFLGPRHSHLLHSMVRTVDSPNARVQEGLELTIVKVSPLAFRSMIVTGQRCRTFRTTKLRARGMPDKHIHLALFQIQRHLQRRPRTLQTKDLLAKLSVLHGAPSQNRNHTKSTQSPD